VEERKNVTCEETLNYLEEIDRRICNKQKTYERPRNLSSTLRYVYDWILQA